MPFEKSLISALQNAFSDFKGEVPPNTGLFSNETAELEDLVSFFFI